MAIAILDDITKSFPATFTARPKRQLRRFTVARPDRVLEDWRAKTAGTDAGGGEGQRRQDGGTRPSGDVLCDSSGEMIAAARQAAEAKV